MAKTDTESSHDAPQSQRLDKWLWFARVAKTRTLASNFVSAGKVRVNRIKTEKPGTSIKIGDVITIAAHGKIRVLRVVDAGKRRGPASEAALLFEDLTPPPQAATAPGEQISVHPGGRPAKKDRRDFEAVRAQHKYGG